MNGLANWHYRRPQRFLQSARTKKLGMTQRPLSASSSLDPSKNRTHYRAEHTYEAV